MKDKSMEKCPECNGKVQRLIGIGAGVIFKDSGFYANDYIKINALSLWAIQTLLLTRCIFR
jgi:predicted nucleic acid-binding Zn ribbon protein